MVVCFLPLAREMEDPILDDWVEGLPEGIQVETISLHILGLTTNHDDANMYDTFRKTYV